MTNFILPYLKAYTAFIVGWLGSNQSQASQFIIDFVAQLGFVLPEPVAGAIVGLVLAVAVWLVPNKK